MRRGRKKSNKTFFIILFITLLMTLALSYATFNDTLEIKGTANAKENVELVFTNASELNKNKSNNIDDSKTNVLVSEKSNILNVTMSGINSTEAKATFNIYIKNTGGCYAKINKIITKEFTDKEYVKINGLDLLNDEIIQPGNSQDFELEIKIQDNIHEITKTEVTFCIEIDFEKVDTSDLGTYVVKYDGNGNDAGETLSSIHTIGISKSLNANAFTKEGYTFLGWSEDKNATSATYVDKQKVNNLSNKDGDTVTLYAIWHKN